MTAGEQQTMQQGLRLPLRMASQNPGEGSDTPPMTDWDAVRARLAAATGRRYWRSLEEMAAQAGFPEALQAALPPEQPALLAPLLRRRDFLRLMGASLALSGAAAGCVLRQPVERIYPYAEQPDGLLPGRPLTFATAVPGAVAGGFGIGVLVRSREGRPVKIEGNPAHPSSLGATDPITQASLLGLYDPDRSQTVLHNGQPAAWEDLLGEIIPALARHRSDGGARLRLLTGAVTSPTLADQIRALMAAFPRARWHTHEPIGRENVYEGARLAFGRPLEIVYRFNRAETILALDADFLLGMPGGVRYARDFMDRRRVRQPEASAADATMNRLYVAEGALTLTGANADHRLPLPSRRIEALARAIAGALGAGPAQPAPEGVPVHWLRAVADDLRAAGSRALIVVGDRQPPGVHALAHALQSHLGSAGTTVYATTPVMANPIGAGNSLATLTTDLQAGQVEMLLILGGCNPVYTTPADLSFAEALMKAPQTIHHGLYADETAALCRWHVPETHFLEAWSDIRAHDGTVTIQQPLILPLYDPAKSAHELLAALFAPPSSGAVSGHDIVKSFWQRARGVTPPAAPPAPGPSHLDVNGNAARREAPAAAGPLAPSLSATGPETPDEQAFDAFWRASLHDGVVAGSAEPMVTLPPIATALPPPAAAPPAAGALSIDFRPDPHIGDGRWANLAWLQELPKPLTTLVWDNAALISPATARQLALRTEDVVELRLGGRSVRAPVFVLPGQPDDVVTVPLGYGRTRAGKVAAGTGFDAYPLRTTEALWFAGGLEVRRTGDRYPLVVAQVQQTMEGRDQIRTATLDHHRRRPRWVRDSEDNGVSGDKPNYLNEWKYTGYKWGMSIDLNICIGCGACTMACQAENNIAVVGKEEVGRGRKMHWIRVDRYFEGDDPNAPEAVDFMPVPCMHCENAPCELVCPVEATVHDEEGINNMIYNRCVGTRYCSNNCPYKVRRFNFLDYSDRTPLMKLLRNPEVTVRTRGVMEKCTYCIQRIKNAEIDAQADDRRLVDGEVQTACQQVCPTRAIVFGDLNDPKAQVTLTKGLPQDYGLLTELNTYPRTTYLGRLRNPNPALEGPPA